MMSEGVTVKTDNEKFNELPYISNVGSFLS